MHRWFFYGCVVDSYIVVAMDGVGVVGVVDVVFVVGVIVVGVVDVVVGVVVVGLVDAVVGVVVDVVVGGDSRCPSVFPTTTIHSPPSSCHRAYV